MRNAANAGRHAIVMGGSMAGLCAARVLSDHFERVTLIERDAFGGLDEQRRGVPQGLHTHGLLAGGARALERMFPGLTRELVQDGAIQGDIVKEARWYHAGGCLARPASGLDGLLVSRPFLESRVRRRVLGIQKIHVLDGTQVDRVIFNQLGDRVKAVLFTDGQALTADLVVDTMGRGSKLSQWLEAAGYQPAQEERVEVALSYTTREFRRTGQEMQGDVAFIVPPTPQGKRGGVLLAQENGRWIVTMISHFGPAAPAELAGYLEFARSLPAPYIHEVISQAEPIGEARVTTYPASRRRRYERLARFPAGLLVMGDAFCSFNPIYGQGMTVAAAEAEALGASLGDGSGQLAKRFFARIAKLVDVPWSIAVGNDLRMPETKGPRTPAVHFINWYIAKLHRAAHHDAKLSIAFHRVANLLEPPESLMNPANALRVLRGTLLPRKSSGNQLPKERLVSAGN